MGSPTMGNGAGTSGKGSPFRAAKFQLAVRLSLDLESLLVHGTMVPAAEQGEVREGSGASLGQ
jgi:hypothetical protein